MFNDLFVFVFITICSGSSKKILCNYDVICYYHKKKPGKKIRIEDSDFQIVKNNRKLHEMYQNSEYISDRSEKCYKLSYITYFF